MRIAVIGAGSVGKTLGHRWRQLGHEVVFGVRQPKDPKHDALRELDVEVTTVPSAARSGEVVVLATPWTATKDAIEACSGLDGKTVIDCTNPLEPDLRGLTHSGDDSGGEQVARWAKGAKVVKAFNTIGFNIMENPRLEGRRAVLFLCGDDDGKPAVKELSDALGFETIDAGSIESARLLEPFALLWITGAYKMGLGRDFAFSLVRREA